MTARQRYGVLFSDRIFVGLLMLGGMNFAGLFTYLSASPFLFQDVYGFTPQQYGLLFGINSLGIVAGVQTSSRLIRRVPPQWILACSTAWMFLMAVLIVVFDQLGFGLWGVMVPLWFYILGTGFTFPCVQVLALASHGAQAGTAASLLGAATFLMAGMISPVVGWLGVSSATPMGAVQACLHLPGGRRTVAGGPAPDRALRSTSAVSPSGSHAQASQACTRKTTPRTAAAFSSEPSLAPWRASSPAGCMGNLALGILAGRRRPALRCCTASIRGRGTGPDPPQS